MVKIIYMKWEVISSEYLYRHPPYFVSRKDVCRQPNGKIVPAYYVVELPASVITFPVIDDKVLMIKQYRHPIEEISWEFPGGFADDNENTPDAAKRELKEETGYVFDTCEYLGKITGNPGILNNFTYVYIAKGNYKKVEQNFDGNEDIQLQLFSFDELMQMLSDNKIIQSLHANACYMALMHLDKLKYAR